MGLLSSLFQRKASADATPANGGSGAAPADDVQRLRTRARQRLIGAVVLVGIAIVGFPLLFESHPRPIPVDIPIVIANKDKLPPLALPPPRGGTAASAAPGTTASRTTASGVVTEAPGETAAKREPAPASTATAKAPEAPAPAVRAEPAPVEKAEPPAPSPPTAATSRSEATVAKAEPSTPQPSASAAAPQGAGRFVVQVGAFAEATAAREARARVEKLGLKTYTQTIETAAGSRIRVRVGPFASRDEADRASAKLKSAGLPAALLTL